MSPYFNAMCYLLKCNDWKEPTKEQYPTYIEAYKKHGRDAVGPYFEDIHFCWIIYKPIE